MNSVHKLSSQTQFTNSVHKLSSQTQFTNSVHNNHAKAHDFGKALAALQKIDYPVVPENFLQCAKDSLPQRKTDVLSQEDRDLLFTKVNSNIAATLANPKSLEKTLFRMKKTAHLGLMVSPLSI